MELGEKVAILIGNGAEIRPLENVENPCLGTLESFNLEL